MLLHSPHLKVPQASLCLAGPCPLFASLCIHRHSGVEKPQSRHFNISCLLWVSKSLSYQFHHRFTCLLPPQHGTHLEASSLVELRLCVGVSTGCWWSQPPMVLCPYSDSQNSSSQLASSLSWLTCWAWDLKHCSGTSWSSQIWPRLSSSCTYYLAVMCHQCFVLSLMNLPWLKVNPPHSFSSWDPAHALSGFLLFPHLAQMSFSLPPSARWHSTW